jgi:hypothetical protein
MEKEFFCYRLSGSVFLFQQLQQQKADHGEESFHYLHYDFKADKE